MPHTVAAQMDNIKVYFIVQTPVVKQNHQKIGGQEVENNLTNCAAYFLYSACPPDQIIRSFFHRKNKKWRTICAPKVIIPMRKQRFSHPIHRKPVNIRIIYLNRFKNKMKIIDIEKPRPVQSHPDHHGWQ